MIMTDIFFAHYENIIQDLFRDKKRIFTQKEEALPVREPPRVYPLYCIISCAVLRTSCLYIYLLPYGIRVYSSALPPFRAV